MRIRTVGVLLFVCLVSPGRTSGRQDVAASRQNTESAGKTKSDMKFDIKSSPEREKENWGVLDDLKTGLVASPVDVVEHGERPGFVREMIRVEWRLTDPIEVWVIRPKVDGKVPVILYMYSYLDTTERFRDDRWCERASAGGFAAVGFVSALTDYRFRYRPFKQWFVSELEESLGSTVHDVQLLLNVLSVRGDMDMDHVGVFGMGSGASIAVLAAQADPRIKTLDLLDPWGDWPDWLKESPLIKAEERTTFLSPEFLKSVAPLDPVAYLPSLKNRSLRLQQTLSEPETPKAAKERIAAAVADPSQLVQYKNPQGLMQAWQTTGLSGWIKHQISAQNPKNGEDSGGAEIVDKGPASRELDSEARPKSSKK
jgi:hypothetical protein